MEDKLARFSVAVVQAAPVAFDREQTLAKVHTLAAEAARQGAHLVVFPEAFVSAYPRGLDSGAVVRSRTDEGREDFRRYWQSRVDIITRGGSCIVDPSATSSRVRTWRRPDIFQLHVDERAKQPVTVRREDERENHPAGPLERVKFVGK